MNLDNYIKKELNTESLQQILVFIVIKLKNLWKTLT